jgi:hypothetical protein
MSEAVPLLARYKVLSVIPKEVAQPPLQSTYIQSNVLTMAPTSFGDEPYL